MLEEAIAPVGGTLPQHSGTQREISALPDNLSLPHLLACSATALGKKLSELKTAQKVMEAKDAEETKKGKDVKKGKKGNDAGGGGKGNEFHEAWDRGEDARRFLEIVAKMDAGTEEVFLRQHGFIRALAHKLVGWGKHFDAARLLSGEGEVRDPSPIHSETIHSETVHSRIPLTAAFSGTDAVSWR